MKTSGYKFENRSGVMVAESPEGGVIALRKLECLLLSDLKTQESELTKLRKRVEVLEDACKAVNEGFNKIMHPGENWFPVMLRIPEALAESAKIAEGEG